MKFELKYLVAALAFTAVGVVHAEALTVKAGGATFQGAGTLSFSHELLDVLDNGHISAVSNGAGHVEVQKDSDAFYTSISASAPMQTLTLDSDSLDFLGFSTKGGLTLTAPVIRSFSSGGSLTLADLAADMSTKTIYATITGGNGVGTVTNFALWKYATLSGATRYAGNGSYVDDFGGLSLTAEGFNKISQALGLLELGQTYFARVKDYGTIHSVFDTTTVCCGPPPTPSVPEPASHILTGLGLGLLGMAVAARRKAN